MRGLCHLKSECDPLSRKRFACCHNLPPQTMTWEYEDRNSKASWYVGVKAPGLADIFTWPPYSCSDPGALCWVYTSRQPPGSFCSSSERFCCTLAASRWSLWTVPEGTKRQAVITSFLSYLHRSECGLSLTEMWLKGSF